MLACLSTARGFKSILPTLAISAIAVSSPFWKNVQNAIQKTFTDLGVSSTVSRGNFYLVTKTSSVTVKDPTLSSKPIEVFTVTVRGRTSYSKNPNWKRTLYLTLNKELVESLRLKEGETLTLGVLKRVLPQTVEKAQEVFAV